MDKYDRLYRGMVCGILFLCGAVPIIAAIDTGHLGYLIPTVMFWALAAAFWKLITYLSD